MPDFREDCSEYGVKLNPSPSNRRPVAEMAAANERQREMLRSQRKTRGETGPAALGGTFTLTQEDENPPARKAPKVKKSPQWSATSKGRGHWGYGVKRPGVDVDRQALTLATQGTKGSAMHKRPDRVCKALLTQARAFNAEVLELLSDARAHKSGNRPKGNPALRELIAMFGDSFRYLVFRPETRTPGYVRRRDKVHKKRGGNNRKAHLT